MQLSGKTGGSIAGGAAGSGGTYLTLPASVGASSGVETLSSTEWQTNLPQTMFVPNYFVDITDTLATKLESLKEYTTEMRPWPHPRSIEGVMHLARWRGACISHDAAEAFMVARIVE